MVVVVVEMDDRLPMSRCVRSLLKCRACVEERKEEEEEEKRAKTQKRPGHNTRARADRQIGEKDRQVETHNHTLALIHSLKDKQTHTYTHVCAGQQFRDPSRGPCERRRGGPQRGWLGLDLGLGLRLGSLHNHQSSHRSI